MKREKKVFYILNTVIWILVIGVTAVVFSCAAEIGIARLAAVELPVLVLGVIANSLNIALLVKHKDQ